MIAVMVSKLNLLVVDQWHSYTGTGRRNMMVGLVANLNDNRSKRPLALVHTGLLGRMAIRVCGAGRQFHRGERVAKLSAYLDW